MDNRLIKRGVYLKGYGQPFLPGMEDHLAARATREQLNHFLANGSIDGDWDEKPAAYDGTSIVTVSELESQLVERLLPYSGEEGDEETAVETLERIIDDRDYARSQILRLQQEKSDSLATHKEIISRFDNISQRLESVASQISGGLGFARHSDESPLESLERYAQTVRDGVEKAIEGKESKPIGEPQTFAPEPPPIVTSNPRHFVEVLIDALGNAEQAQVLVDAGFDTVQKLEEASDSQLLKLASIGKAAVGKIRDYFAE